MGGGAGELIRLLGGRPVAVLLGGVSNERAVSLVSGGSVAEALERLGLAVRRIDVGPDFRERGRAQLAGAGLAFVVLHGEFGEDGQVQALLEAWGVPYTGSGPAASSLAMDKNASKRRFLDAGVATPRWVVCGKDDAADRAVEELGLPLVIKPSRSGSSIGVSIVRGAGDIGTAVTEAARHDSCVIAEEFIAGRELTVGVLGGRALPAIELVTRRGFYDYEAKYSDGAGTEYVCPVAIAGGEQAVRDLALAAHQALGCRHFSRVDIMLRGSNETPFVLEVNTIPGFTGHSLLPKAAAAAGMGFGDLCREIAVMALRSAGRSR
jgi:D-alanine-D-alanine ligase